jgi:hypothetical protein
MIDLNAPDNSNCELPLIKLYRHVIIVACRDACLSKQDAYDNYIWSMSKDAYYVCQWAELDRGMVTKFFKKIYKDDDERLKAANSMSYFKSITVTKRSTIKTEPVRFIQQELFT